MEPEGLLPHSRVSSTCPYLEPAQSSPYPHIPLPEDPIFYLLLTFQVPNLMSLFRCSGRTKHSFQLREFVCEYFVTKIRFHGEELLAPHPTPKLEDHPLSSVHDCLFNISAATLHIRCRSSLPNASCR
jgi:hypothetical protein